MICQTCRQRLGVHQSIFAIDPKLFGEGERDPRKLQVRHYSFNAAVAAPLSPQQGPLLLASSLRRGLSPCSPSSLSSSTSFITIAHERQAAVTPSPVALTDAAVSSSSSPFQTQQQNASATSDGVSSPAFVMPVVRALRPEESMAMSVSSSALLPKKKWGKAAGSGGPAQVGSGGRSTTALVASAVGTMSGSAVVEDRPVECSVIEELIDMFVTASAESGDDHPMCLECARKTILRVNEALRRTRDKIAVYRSAAKEMSVVPRRAEIELEQESKRLELEEQRLRRELSDVRAQKEQVAEGLAEVARKAEWLSRLEGRYFANHNQESRAVVETEGDLGHTMTALRRTRAKFAILRSRSALNDAFPIWHDGHFGTINGLRLGRLVSVPVEWSESNAAWGECVALLAAVWRALNFESPTWSLAPLGDASQVRRKSGTGAGASYELCGEVGRGLLFWESKYDLAMCGFLTCLGQTVDYVHDVLDPEYSAPYVVDKEASKIGDLSVRYYSGANGSAGSVLGCALWTRAMKFVLTDLKSLVSWVTARTLPSMCLC